MIDFRYHLVCIVSIFLALAVGIVLGAGPLQGELGDTLTNEVAGLRQDKAQLNAQLSDATAEIDARELGFEVQVFAMVRLLSQSERDLSAFEALARGWPLACSRPASAWVYW